MKVTCLVENLVWQPGLKGEHGLSLWIETESMDILFDTGQSRILLENAQHLGLNIKTLKHVILSHGHYDHTGGLKYLLQVNPDISIYVHPSIWVEKYRANGGFIGLDIPYQSFPANFKVSSSHIELQPGLYVDPGLFPANTLAQYNQDLTVCRAGTLLPDNFEEEQYLVLEQDAGLVLITACSHRGIIRIIDGIHSRYTKRIHTVIGGLHLSHEGPEEVLSVIKLLEKRNIEKLYVGHCTGIKVYCMMKKVFKGKVEYLHTGRVINL